MNPYVADLRQRLEQLNRLEEQLQDSRAGGDGGPGNDARIKSLRANLLPHVLTHHSRFRSRGKRSVAEVRRGVCSSCHMGLPIGTALALKYQTELVKCNNCGRYIFLARDELSPALPQELAKKVTQPSRTAPGANR